MLTLTLFLTSLTSATVADRLNVLSGAGPDQRRRLMSGTHECCTYYPEDCPIGTACPPTGVEPPPEEPAFWGDLADFFDFGGDLADFFDDLFGGQDDDRRRQSINVIGNSGSTIGVDNQPGWGHGGDINVNKNKDSFINVNNRPGWGGFGNTQPGHSGHAGHGHSSAASGSASAFGGSSSFGGGVFGGMFGGAGASSHSSASAHSAHTTTGGWNPHFRPQPSFGGSGSINVNGNTQSKIDVNNQPGWSGFGNDINVNENAGSKINVNNQPGWRGFGGRRRLSMPKPKVDKCKADKDCRRGWDDSRECSRSGGFCVTPNGESGDPCTYNSHCNESGGFTCTGSPPFNIGTCEKKQDGEWCYDDKECASNFCKNGHKVGGGVCHSGSSSSSAKMVHTG